MSIILPAGLYACASILLFILGYSNEVKKQIQLISGFSSDGGQNMHELANRFGRRVMHAGTVCFITAILLVVFQQYVLQIVLSSGILIVLLAVGKGIDCKRFRK